jgi:hypothetical protein
MGLRDLLSVAAAQVAAAGFVRFEPGRRELALGARVVEPAVRHALQRAASAPAGGGTPSGAGAAPSAAAQAARLLEPAVRVEADGVHLSARTPGGVRVAALVVPRALELEGDVLVARAHLPRGLELRHDSAALGLALGFFDGLLGASERLVERHLEGATLRGGDFTYRRPVGELRLVRTLRELGALQPGARSRIQLGMREGWLTLDLREAVPPGVQLDLAGLVRRLVPPG